MQLAEPVLTTERNVLSTEQSGVLGSNLSASGSRMYHLSTVRERLPCTIAFFHLHMHIHLSSLSLSTLTKYTPTIEQTIII